MKITGIENHDNSDKLKTDGQEIFDDKPETKDALSDNEGDVHKQLSFHQRGADVLQDTIDNELVQDFPLHGKPNVTSNSITERENEKIIDDNIETRIEKDNITSGIDAQNNTAKKSENDNELNNKSNWKRKRFKKIKILKITSSSDDDIVVINNDIQDKLSLNNNKVTEEIIDRKEKRDEIENIKISVVETKEFNEHDNITNTSNVIDKEANKEILESDSEVFSNTEPTQVKIQNTDTIDNSNEPKKPLLRCVDIKKLLKPESDVSNTVETVISTGKNEKKSQSKMDETTKQFINSHIIHKKVTTTITSVGEQKPPLIKKIVNRDESKGNYHKVMKEKIITFKPKKCCVNIVRLPKITEEFLRSHKLRKIIQKGSTVLELNFTKSDCEIKKNVNKEEEVEIDPQINNTDTIVADKMHNPKRKKESNKMSIDVTKVKNALLDSDSDRIESAISSSDKEKIIEPTENLDNSLLPNSVTEMNMIEKSKSNTQAHNENTLKNTGNLLCERHLEVPEQISKENVGEEPPAEAMEQNDNSAGVKNLNETNDNAKIGDVIDVALSKKIFRENTPPKKKRRRERSGSTPQSKRKRIMESMKAKRMLLTYSSSSDTDDEQLRNALKDIKKHLMKGINSDEESKKESSQDISICLKKQDLSSNNSPNDVAIEKNGFNKEEIDKTNCRNININNKEAKSPLNNNSDILEKKDEKRDIEKLDLCNIMSHEENVKKTGEENENVCEEFLERSLKNILDTGLNTKVIKNNEDHGVPTSDKHNYNSDEEHSINLPKKSNKARKELLKSSSDDSSGNDVISRKHKHSEESSSAKEKTSSDEGTMTDKKKKDTCQERLNSPSSENSDDSINKRNSMKKDWKKSDILNKRKDGSKESSENERKDMSSKASSISQIDGNMDESGSDSCKMGRSKMKASGSNGQSSDSREALDKDIDGLTNLKSLNKSRQHRESKTHSNTDGEKTKKKHKMNSEVPTINTQQLLEQESDSSAESSGSENVDSEEVSEIPNINGGSIIDNLAKGDLLQDSDTSSSETSDKQDEKTGDVKDEQDSDAESDENNVKSRRRKAHAISSDSEGGSRKKAEPRISDFEDSEAESSEPVKNTKRKKKASDSDASVGASSSDGGGLV
ncbi:hypothetical protein EVAR_21470_1 [Eumeta japonica]|uniref:Uncharacterized protein n=1 Tax=Eumeta variegata TaxID=151549 RepID=A0A4C1VJ44_EUMVA|nr:hypothetical protein EVAR_21470_1 [Eumeta japonica]